MSRTKPTEAESRYLSVECSECGATEGQWCETCSGGWYSLIHACRRSLFQWRSDTGQLPPHKASMRAEGEECRRCGGPNFIWFAPSPLWNLVMRENDINGPIQYADLVCSRCFMELAAEKGLVGTWRLTLDPEPAELVKVTPSGRVWNDKTSLWEDRA